MIGKDPEPPKTDIEAAKDQVGDFFNENCPSLSFKQRMIGFVICASVGYLLAFGSFFRFAKVPHPSLLSPSPSLSPESTPDASCSHSQCATCTLALPSTPTLTWQCLAGDCTRFAVIYSLGNIIALAATFFLVGPCKQVKQMFSETRRVATIVFLCAIACTITFALVKGLSPKVRVTLIVISCLVQLLAWIWYCLSYIPFGRACVKNAFRGYCGKCMDDE
eukprot:TRINITY_DN6458_c0_g1_i2.p1 TRINITY_DN6458_c0_g1~~TRINITY_DN6458_c0_g1_i2.p1  ORF type:complete len:220 (-),score=33.22 TRINITY_DN6458_c0_g1_i2:403-1062(-)